MKYRRVVRLFDPHGSRDIVPLLGDIAPCYSLEWEDVENPEMQRRDLENPGMQRRRRHVVSDPPPAHKRPVEAPFQLCLKSKLESRFRLTRMLKRKKGGLLGVANCMTPPNLHTARIQLANCLDGVQRETLDPLASILRGEMNFVQTYEVPLACRLKDLPSIFFQPFIVLQCFTKKIFEWFYENVDWLFKACDLSN